MSPKFYLLGECNAKNPSAISPKQLQSWENAGLIKYLGVCSDVREIISACDCVVLPSSYKEGVPRILLEALALGKAIITTNASGCKECVATPLKKQGIKKQGDFLLGKNGILIEPKDSIALKNAIEYLCKNPHLLNEFGQNGAEIAKEFDMKNIIKIYQNALDSADFPLDSANRKKFAESGKIIAFISNTCFAMWNFRFGALKALQNNGHTIHIIAPFDTSTKKLQDEGFIVHHIYIDSKSLNPLKDLKTALQIYRALRKIKPNIVFSYTIKCVIYGSFVANFLKIPNIAVITGLGYVFIGQNLKKQILQKIVCKMYQIALKRTKQVWFLNNDDKGEFIKRKIIAESSSFLLKSEGVDLEHFNPQFIPTKALLPQKQKDEIRFVLIARMLWDKGVGEFIEAIKMIKQNASDTGGGD